MVFSTFLWRDTATDPSAFHRLHHTTTLTNLLHANQIPLADVPLRTAMRIGWERSPRKAAHRLWPNLAPPIDPHTGQPVTDFCADTALLAATAAIAVGIATALAVTQDRLDLLANGGAQFPFSHRPPRTLRQWKSLTGATD